jgi:hypothetical protein
MHRFKKEKKWALKKSHKKGRCRVGSGCGEECVKDEGECCWPVCSLKKTMNTFAFT